MLEKRRKCIDLGKSTDAQVCMLNSVRSFEESDNEQVVGLQSVCCFVQNNNNNIWLKQCKTTVHKNANEYNVPNNKGMIMHLN